MGLSPLLGALGILVLERQPEGAFLRRGALPAWCDALASEAIRGERPFIVEDVFPFLTVFLNQAETVWRGETKRVASDFWTEVVSDGEELHLEASAVRVGSKAMLAITENNRLFRQQQLVLQRARELRIAHDALMQETDHKEILVHAIVHDLAAPLHSILGALSLLDELDLEQSGKQWIHIATRAAERQRDLIREILEVFSTEHAVTDLDTPPAAIARVVAQVVSELGPVAQQRRVRLAVEDEAPACHVVGEEPRLFRVLTNFMDNALRHSPENGLIRVSVRRLDGAVQLTTEDEGPGVPVALLPHLFELFARGSDRGGTGLGLYFCRITVERWGGSIGYETRPEGGARFWIRLPVVEPDAVAATLIKAHGGKHGEPLDPR
jgi:signal transduction histidine kinase